MNIQSENIPLQPPRQMYERIYFYLICCIKCFTGSFLRSKLEQVLKGSEKIKAMGHCFRNSMRSSKRDSCQSEQAIQPSSSHFCCPAEPRLSTKFISEVTIPIVWYYQMSELSSSSLPISEIKIIGFGHGKDY